MPRRSKFATLVAKLRKSREKCQIYLNLLIKPDEQSKTCFSSAMAKNRD